MSAGNIWPDGARLALSLVVNVEEGAEMSVADGDSRAEAVDELGLAVKPGYRNYANESNYRYGIEAGAPRILDLLAKHRVPATFTAAAQSLERAPALARRIAAEGHEACAHGYRWRTQHTMDEDTERAFIARAADSIEASTGTRPVGWLSRYLFSANTRRLLIEAGFRYHMDDFSADRPFWDAATVPGRPILILPYALDSNDMKMWNAPAYTPRHWLDYANDTFAWLHAEGAAQPRMMSLGVHLRIIGRPGRIGALERFIERARSHDGVWFATRAQIAEHWAAQVEPPPKPVAGP